MNAPARYVCYVTARGSEACRAMGVSRLLIRFSRIGIFIALDSFQLLKAETRGCSQIATHAIFLRTAATLSAAM